MNENGKETSFLQKLFGDGPVTILHKKNGRFILDVVYESESKSRTMLMAGNMQTILSDLKHEPAKAIEIEAAIADIEDQLMPIIKDLPERRCLVTSEQAFWGIAKVAGLGSDDELQMNVDTVEEIFNRLVDVAYGTPASKLEVPENREFTAIVLFLRELMHHASFYSIILRR
ncbi:MAG: hypothetical protein JXR26_08480 [Balneolaceae bacterium]|nr:hypothetical protein [Balneolaceae bacterium]